ncbi:hypothetical protein Tco_0921219, partial [Tanacetum coccineum]
MPATPSPTTVCINLQEIWCRCGYSGVYASSSFANHECDSRSIQNMERVLFEDDFWIEYFLL